ncbi:MAG: FAD-binding protein [Alphaproteobacteria bacterium]|jgi:FAD/FMN-containing dehydrogenase|nr:FAD-binding protein [Alphaproteobacteria bacterium]
MTPIDVSKPDDTAIAGLDQRLRGAAILPGDPGYDEGRTLWNAMFDRRPALIVRPRGAADVQAAIGFARDHHLEIALKGGAHNVAGNAACDGGMVIDFAHMTSVRVDPQARTAVVEPGCLIRDLDAESQAHGLATPGGFISSTGMAGLTLGGGFGYLSRKHGLTVDNLRAVDLVTANGAFVRASGEQNPELFWALRGGGGNFGVVTAFEFNLHDLGPQVLAGPVVHAFEDAPAVMRKMAALMREAPDEVSCLPVIRHAPPAPFIPQAYHGNMIVLFGLIHAGDPEEGEASLAPFREIGNPIGDALSRKPYTAFQSMFDKTAEHGARNYWKAHYLDDLSDGAIDTLCKRAAAMPSKESSIGMLSLGGEVARRPRGDAPYPHRDAGWVVNIQARWREAGEDDTHIAWARETFEALTPHSTGGVYVNFISRGEGDARVREAYGSATYDRLARVKAAWDPENVFHLNQNISPGTQAHNT